MTGPHRGHRKRDGKVSGGGRAAGREMDESYRATVG